jgi:hypothetical protein
VNGASIESGVPHSLFGLAQVTVTISHAPYLPFAVTADGQRFLVSQLGARPAEAAAPPRSSPQVDQGTAIRGGPVNLSNPVIVVLNCTQMLKGK